MRIVEDSIVIDELRRMAEESFAGLVKAVVDVEREIVAVDSDLHADLESLLLDNGSRQNDLWGINLYPGVEGEGLVEFDSMINVRPSQNNRSRAVENEEVRRRIIEVLDKRIAK